MSTLGQKPAIQHVSMEKQTITGNGSTSYTLQQSVGSALDVAVFINNTRQEPTTAYSASGTTLTMTGAVNSSDHFYVIFLGKAITTTGLPVDAVATANINASAITNAKIANSTIDLTSKVTGILPTANGGTGNAVGSTTTYVNNLSVSGSSTQTEFETNLTGTALSGGAKTLRIFMTGLSNESNGYMHFRIKSSDGYTDGGYAAGFAYNSGSSFNSNGNTDANQNNAMAIGYYGGTYNIVVDCFLIDPSTNRWIMDGRSMSKDTSAAVHGNSIADNALGASKPITGFKFSSANSNGLGVANIKYGYSYTT